MSRHWLNFVLEQPAVHPAGYLGTVHVDWDGSRWTFHLDDLSATSPRKAGRFRLTLDGSASEADTFTYLMPGGSGTTREQVLAYAQDQAWRHVFGDDNG